MGCALSRLPCIRGWLLSPAPALIVARRRAELRRVRVPAGAGARVALPVILPEEPGPDFSHIDHTLLVFKNGRRSGPLGAIPLAERLRAPNTPPALLFAWRAAFDLAARSEM